MNIPKYVAEKALSSGKFTAAELAVIEPVLYRYCLPDWSEDSYETTWGHFRIVLALASRPKLNWDRLMADVPL
jgi:hypothetical protein